jgi:TolB-like protein/Tfp pilus assembly protein PilF
MSELPGIVSFGPFRLDRRKRVLWKGTDLVPLPPKALDLLLALVEQQGDVVRKQDLMEQVWPDTFVEEANLSVNVSALRKALGDGPDAQPYIQTVPRRGYRFVVAGSGPGAGIPSLAVLPFQNLTPSAEDEYLGVGIADALITKLGRVGRLIVRPTSSVLKYAAAPADARTAGRELKVDAVLTGTLQRDKGRLRVSVQLVSLDTGSPAWGETFEEPLTSLFAVQDAAADRVARALELELRGPEKERLVRRHTEDVEAYRAYLKGRYFWTRFTGPWLEKALSAFQEAAESDPGYALPHAGLADAYLILGFSGLLPPRDVWPMAAASARRALELDESLPEAHVSLAYVGLFQDWDWAAAGRELERALALAPNSSAVHQWYGLFLDMSGRFEEADARIARAQELDPLSLVGGALAGFQHYLRRAKKAELAQWQGVLDLDPNHFLGHWGLGLALQGRGRHDEAVEHHRTAERLAGGVPLVRPVLARSLALAGRGKEARSLVREQEGTHLSSYQRATVHLALGEPDRALDFLERAGEERDPWMVWIKVDPMLAPVRKHPRLRALERQVFARA